MTKIAIYYAVKFAMKFFRSESAPLPPKLES